jgi:ubiquinone/menaquinone biosynthesis C-methylase UbiE
MIAASALDLLCCPRCASDLRGAEDGARCQHCGAAYPGEAGYLDLLGATAPAPSPFQRLMENGIVARIYERYWRPLFLGTLLKRGLDFESEYALARAMLEVGRTTPILDLSCGPALYARRFAADDPEALVVGLDRSREMLAQGRRGALLSNLALVRADAENLPVREGSLGGVFNSAALHLYPDVARVFRGVARALRPGGTYVASTFLHRAGPLGGAQQALFRPFGLRLFDEEELRGLLAQAGLVGYERVRLGPLIQFRVRRP